jgi:uncharacterized membrane protein
MPLLLWGTALGFDAMSRFTGELLLGDFAVWPLGIGLFLAASTVAGEFYGWLRLSHSAPNLRITMWLLLADLATLSLIAASLWLRLTESGSPVQLTLLGFGAALLTGLARDAIGPQATHLRVAPPAERAPRVEKATTPR